MARITKEIQDLLRAFDDHAHCANYDKHKMEEIYHKLKELGMTDKQLEDRDIAEYHFL